MKTKIFVSSVGRIHGLIRSNAGHPLGSSNKVYVCDVTQGRISRHTLLPRLPMSDGASAQLYECRGGAFRRYLRCNMDWPKRVVKMHRKLLNHHDHTYLASP